MKKKILCTLGPASLRPDVIQEIDARHIDLFRINLSHTPIDELDEVIEFVQRQTATPLCIDTEGAQVRCGRMEPNVAVSAGDPIRLTASDVKGTARELTLRPGSIFGDLRAGNLVSIDFDGALLRVVRADCSGADAIAVDGGRIGSNKAVTIDPTPRLPALTEGDIRAIDISARRGIRHFALSFANSADDVLRLRELAPAGAYVIAKIESRAGVQDVDRITRASDAILIDRGDLSREVAIELVPICQKYIIRRANASNKPVLVATNLLESMIEHRRPTLAEANDIINTLLDGAHGLVLAAETAVGSYPVHTVDMVQRLLRAFELATDRPILDDAQLEPASAA